MMQTPTRDPLRDPDRLDALMRARLLDTPPEQPFDRLTSLAARVMDMPIALVSLVDDKRQFFKSAFGLPEPWASQRGTPLSHSFCRHVVERGAVLRIEDARDDERVRDNSGVTALGVIAYLGVPLTTPNGHTLGSFCVMSPKPVSWRRQDVATLTDLGASVMSEISLRCAHEDLLAANEQLGQEAARREAALHRLRINEARLRTAQRLAHVGSLEVSLDGRPETYWSDEACRIMSLSAGQPPATLSAFVRQLVHADDRARVEAIVGHALRHGQVAELEYRVCLPHGEVKTVRSAVEIDERSNGESVAVCTVADISERQRAEAALAEYRHQLWHVARVATAGEMATIMAHELNQPLAAISYTASGLRRLNAQGRLDGADLGEHLDSLTREAHRASAIIKRVRGFVRKQSRSCNSIDLNRTVRDLLRLAEPLTRRLGVDVAIMAGPDLPLVQGDEIEIGQIVLNVLRNAMDAVAGNPDSARRVEIATFADARGQAVIQISDSGPGIAAEVRSRIFQPFYTTRSNGLGMGLVISRTIAEAHGGGIDVLDEPAALGGAVVQIRLPGRHN